MTKDQKDPLETLFTSDAKAVDRQQLVALVAPYISIDRTSREFGFLPSFAEINGNVAKIEILLAAVKARALHLNEPDGLLPIEIITTGIMPAGSVKTSIKTLSGSHKIKKDKGGRYFLPSYRIPELIKQFTNTNA